MNFAKILARGGKLAEKIRSIIDSWDGFKFIDLQMIYRKMQYRISVKRLFRKGQYEKLGDYEKKRVRKIARHLTTLWWLGKLFEYFLLIYLFN